MQSPIRQISDPHTAVLLKSLAAGALALLLCGCGKPDTASASGNTASAGNDVQVAPTATANPDDDDDGEHHAGLSIPMPGTLHYAIALTGELQTTGKHKGEFRNAVIKRNVDVTSHMEANLINGSLADVSPARPRNGDSTAEAANAPIEALASEMEKCNDNMACIMQLTRKHMADPTSQQAIQDAGDQFLGSLGRVALWSRAVFCDGRMAIDDSDDHATWWEDIGEGYHKTGLDRSRHEIHADDKFGCMPSSPAGAAGAAIEAMADGTRIWFDTQTGDYDVTFGPSKIEVTPTVNGKPGKPVQVGIPEIALTGFSGAALGKSFSGTRSVDVENEGGVPLHGEVSWTFTPDQG